MTPRALSILAGGSYLIIFFAAIFANFLVLESLLEAPLETVQQNQGMVRLGILAFLITAVFDVVVAWALYELYRNHPLSGLSASFRMIHAALMGAAVFALPPILDSTTPETILEQVDAFNTLWLIGLFFFGIHLVLLGRILKRPRWIVLFLILAGVMYMADTAAHVLLPDYAAYADVFLALVAVPSILGELSLAIWLLAKGGKMGVEA